VSTRILSLSDASLMACRTIIRRQMGDHRPEAHTTAQ
jgi:hypothetical protein